MKTKVLSAVVGVMMVCAVSIVADEYGYFLRSATDATEFPQDPVVLRAGDRLQMLSSDRGSWGLNVTFPNGQTVLFDNDFMGCPDMTATEGDILERRTIVDPCEVKPALAGSALYISYRIIRASDGSINPSNVIVLPADVDGDMQLVFESSNDLLTWDQVYSFSHNSTNQTSKFFRTRLIQGTGE